jgi:hemerythrin-like domain-containing protein
VLVKFLPADNPLVLQMFKNMHRYVTSLSLSIKNQIPGSLQLLAEFVNNHIRFEERELFAYAEKTLTQEQLEEIYTRTAT